MAENSDKVQKLRDAGLSLPDLSADAQERIESLSDAEVEALVSAAHKLSSPEGLQLAYQGNYQYPGFEEW